MPRTEILKSDVVGYTYLGDSVYAKFEHEMIELVTFNCAGVSNQIYLDVDVIKNLRDFIKKNRRIGKCSMQTN